jgi:nucleoside-diphosphate-sugar epimerase
LRLFSPYGYFEDPDRLVPYLIKSCMNHEPVVLYNPDAFRDFIFIEDVVNAYLCVAAAPFKSVCGGVFNVGTGKQYCVRDVFDIVKKVTHYEKEAVVGNNPSRMRPGDKSIVWKADITRIMETFGWKASVSLSEGIERTVVWFNKRSFK